MNKEERREKELYHLYENCETITNIYCSNCNDSEMSAGDSMDASEEFQATGWRATDQYIYCPECAKKKLKSKI